MLDVLGNYLAADSEFISLVPTIVRTRLPKDYDRNSPALVICGPFDHDDGRTSTRTLDRKVQMGELELIGKTHSALLSPKKKLLTILRAIKDIWVPSSISAPKVFTQCVLIENITETNSVYDAEYSTRANPGSDEKGFPIIRIEIKYAFDEPST